jgi:hypothetical protein
MKKFDTLKINWGEKKMSNLVHNERTKMLANLFNNLGVVSLASGVLGPIFSARISATPLGFSEGGYAIRQVLSLNALGAISVGIVLCVLCAFVAQSLLLKLKE